MCKGQECPQKSFHRPTAISFIKNTQFFWGVIELSLRRDIKCIYCLLCKYGINNRPATRMTRYCGLTTYGGNRDARVYKSLKVQIFRLATVRVLDFSAAMHFDRLIATLMSVLDCTCAAPRDDFMKLLTSNHGATSPWRWCINILVFSLIVYSLHTQEIPSIKKTTGLSTLS